MLLGVKGVLLPFYSKNCEEYQVRIYKLTRYNGAGTWSLTTLITIDLVGTLCRGDGFAATCGLWNETRRQTSVRFILTPSTLFKKLTLSIIARFRIILDRNNQLLWCLVRDPIEVLTSVITKVIALGHLVWQDLVNWDQLLYRYSSEITKS